MVDGMLCAPLPATAVIKTTVLFFSFYFSIFLFFYFSSSFLFSFIYLFIYLFIQLLLSFFFDQEKLLQLEWRRE